MNNDSDQIKSLFFELLQPANPTIPSPSGDRVPIKAPIPEESASEVGSEAVSSERSQDSFETAQSFNFGDISTVQDRSHALLRNRLRLEFENRLPVFPWENEVKEYPVELPIEFPAFAQQPVSHLMPAWWPQIEQFRVANTLPQAVISQLLERCQVMAQSSLKQGSKLVKTVEALFPDYTSALDPIAQIVLTPAYRSSSRQSSVLQELETIAGSYDSASPEQQIALSMMAAQEIMSALTLAVSVQQPRLTREWITAQGLLTLDMVYQDGMLLFHAQMPSGGELRLLGNACESTTVRSQRGRLSLVESEPEIGKTYVLEVTLQESGHRPLRFAVSVSEDADTLA
jgi:hypothetical protein